MEDWDFVLIANDLLTGSLLARSTLKSFKKYSRNDYNNDCCLNKSFKFRYGNLV
jgi:hypothetical protein